MNPREGDRVTLRSPKMRENLLKILHSLADAEYQNKLWLNQGLIPALNLTTATQEFTLSISILHLTLFTMIRVQQKTLKVQLDCFSRIITKCRRSRLFYVQLNEFLRQQELTLPLVAHSGQMYLRQHFTLCRQWKMIVNVTEMEFS